MSDYVSFDFKCAWRSYNKERRLDEDMYHAHILLFNEVGQKIDTMIK